MDTNQTDFGFEKVSFKEKTLRVKNLFTHVAYHYDLMNDLMSFGLHRCWKKSFIHRLPLNTHSRILDVASGTGDIALQLQKTYAHLQLDITLYDLTFHMLLQGRDKAINNGLLKGLNWSCGNAEQLPFADHTFDIYTIAFGIRNISNRTIALQEALRILKPGGWFFCLEFSKVTLPLLKHLYNLYSFQFLPKIGKYVAQDQDAYQYLVESIAQFPSQDSWKKEIEWANFTKVTFESWYGGIIALHQGQKSYL